MLKFQTLSLVPVQYRHSLKMDTKGARQGCINLKVNILSVDNFKKILRTFGKPLLSCISNLPIKAAIQQNETPDWHKQDTYYVPMPLLFFHKNREFSSKKISLLQCMQHQKIISSIAAHGFLGQKNCDRNFLLLSAPVVQPMLNLPMFQMKHLLHLCLFSHILLVKLLDMNSNREEKFLNSNAVCLNCCCKSKIYHL